MTRSKRYLNRLKTIPGGVNSPVRAFNGVGGSPCLLKKANGAYIYDADGKAYIDYVGSWGPMILGHNHPKIRAAVLAAVENGLSFGAQQNLKCKWPRKSSLWCLLSSKCVW